MEQMEGKEKVGGNGLPGGRERIVSFGIIKEISKRKREELEKASRKNGSRRLFRKVERRGDLQCKERGWNI